MESVETQGRSLVYSKLVDFFSKDPERYNWIHLCINWGLPYRYVAKVIDLRPSHRVLDIACGPAMILDHLPDAAEYVGVDSNSRHLEYARSRYATRRCRFIEADLTTYDLSQHERFDRILMLGFLHHLSDVDLSRFLSRLAPALAPGGTVVTFDPVYTRYHFVSNKLCDLDQGRFARDKKGYVSILKQQFGVREANVIWSRSKASRYLVTKCVRKEEIQYA